MTKMTILSSYVYTDYIFVPFFPARAAGRKIRGEGQAPFAPAPPPEYVLMVHGGWGII